MKPDLSCDVSKGNLNKTEWNKAERKYGME